MKHLLSFSLAVSVIASSAQAQFPETCTLLDAGFLTTGWGGAVQTPDGGVVISGIHDPNNSGHADIVLTKLDVSGALQWMRLFSTGPNASEYGMAVINTSDDGLAVAGHLPSGAGYLMKLDAAGVAQWTMAYAHPDYLLQMAHNSLVQLADGGFALHWGTLLGNYGWIMLRTDATGNVVWSDELNFAGGSPLDVAALPNGDLVFTGRNTSLGPYDLILRKDGLTGATEWMHWYAAGVDEYLDFDGLVVGPDSTIVVGGTAYGTTFVDAFAMALTADGTPIWSTRTGGPLNENAKDIAWDPTEGYVLAGETREVALPYTLLGGFVARIDANGAGVWGKFFTHPDVNTISPMHCATTADGGVLITGESGTSQNYPQFLTKLDADGNSCAHCPSADAGTANAMTVTIGTDQGFAFAGPWATASAFTGFTVTDITPAVEVCGSMSVGDLLSSPLVTVAPNPFSDHAVITMEPSAVQGEAWIDVHDVLGRVVHSQRVQGSSTTIQRGALAPGRYAFRIQNNTSIVAHGVLQVADR